MAVEEEARGARLSGTEFRVVRGSNFEPGMLLRECRKPVDYQANCFGVDVGFGVIPGLGAASDVNIRWLHNFTPNFGWDVIGVKGIYGSGVRGVQVMSGVHLQTSQLINPKKIPLVKRFVSSNSKQSLYGDFKVLGSIIESRLAMGFEVGGGINFNKTFFAGFAYNHLSGNSSVTEFVYPLGSGEHHYVVDLNINYLSLRAGFNF
jgi:hypothetical protein